MLQHVASIDDDRGIEKPVPRVLWFAALVSALFIAWQSLAYSYGGAGLDRDRGTIGIGYANACDRDRFCDVERILPAFPAARAGIRPGDAVRLDRYWERHRVYGMGEAMGITVRRDGAVRHLTLVTERSPKNFWPTYVAGGLISFTVCMVALLVVARAGRRWPGLLLGLALIAYGLPGNYPRLWQNEPSLFPWFLVGLSVLMVATPVLMLLALRFFRADVIGRVPRWLDRLIWSVAVAELLILAWGMTIELNVAPLFGVADGLSLLSLGASVGSLVAPLALAAGWRSVPAESRTRYAFMWAAISVTSIYALIDPLIMLTGNNYTQASWPVLIQLGALLFGTILFAYALLRHRVIDLGFAINRTLVFSSLSFIVLLAFGLVEWGTEKLLPFESHEASVLIDAAIALSLFLAFHRVHKWVEHGVERLFFHSWHLDQAALARFVAEAPFITRADTLLERAVAAFETFAGGAQVALYRAEARGYALAAGGLAGQGAMLDPDLPSLVTLRADRTALHDGFGAGSLALPMTHRADLVGVVVVGPKPSGDPYRPDEEAQLAEAVRRVGLDLYALRIEELEADNARLYVRLDAVAA